LLLCCCRTCGGLEKACGFTADVVDVYRWQLYVCYAVAAAAPAGGYPLKFVFLLLLNILVAILMFAAH